MKKFNNNQSHTVNAEVNRVYCLRVILENSSNSIGAHEPVTQLYTWFHQKSEKFAILKFADINMEKKDPLLNEQNQELSQFVNNIIKDMV